MARLSRTEIGEVNAIVRKQVVAFFSSADGIAVLSLALQALMGAAQDGATVLAGKQPEQVIEPPETPKAEDSAPEPQEDTPEADEPPAPVVEPPEADKE